MLARRIILGFGFAVVLPLLVHYGIEVAHPSFADQDGYVEVNRLAEREGAATGEEKARLRAERERREDDLRAQARDFSRVHFFVGAPIGVVVTLAGSLVATQAIGGGLMLGGIFTFGEGCWWHWADLQPLGRFLVLLLAFAVLLWIGCQRLSDATGEARVG